MADEFQFSVGFQIAEILDVVLIQCRLEHEQNYYEGSPAVSRIAVRPPQEVE